MSTSIQPFSLEEVEKEIVEKSTDLEVFAQARQMIRQRVQDLKDSPSRLTPLPNWSGTDAVLGSLDLAIHAMERTLVELSDIRLKLRQEKPEPFLRLVPSTGEM